MKFKCYLITSSGEERWSGVIVNLKNYGSHYEMKIESRSTIMVLFGKTSLGYFACIPDWNSGCHLVGLKDLFWNKEQLINVLGSVDGTTVAFALKAIASKLRHIQKITSQYFGLFCVILRQ